MSVTTYKGFKIQEVEPGLFFLFTAEEWAYGKGYRYPEHEAGSIEEAKEFIDCY